jgi:hypothetical protein
MPKYSVAESRIPVRNAAGLLAPLLGVGCEVRHLYDVGIAGGFPLGNVGRRDWRAGLLAEPAVKFALADVDRRELL